MNKEFGRTSHGSSSGGTAKTHEKTLRLAGLPAEIRNEDLPMKRNSIKTCSARVAYKP
jgi:hypothetical protein